MYMKKNIFSVLMAGLAIVSLGACSDSSYDEKYADPSKTTTVSVPDVFTSVLYKGNTWMNPMYYRYYCQTTTSGTFSGIIGNSNSKGRFIGAGEARYDDRWKAFYDMLTQYRLLEKTYNDLDESLKANNKVFVLLSRTLVESQLHEMLSLFGGVPFTGAGTLWNSSDYADAKAKAVYDDDTELYKTILADLKEASDYLSNEELTSVAKTSLQNKDYTNAGGSVTKWQRYINSLRLRIALHLSTNGSLTSEAHAAIKEILENPSQYPVIESNDQNMGVEPSTNDDTFNFGKSLSQALHGGYSPSQEFLDALNLPADGKVDANTDPRISVLLDCNPDNQYITYDITKSNNEISTLATDKENAYKEKFGSKCTARYYCTLDSTSYAGVQEYGGNNNTFGLWIGAAEVSLSKAEAYLMGYGVAKDETKAKENFINGIKQSTDFYWDFKLNSSFYNASNPNDSYKSYRPIVVPTAEEITAYAENIWEPTQEAICTQLWLNFGWTNELEAWNVTRRTGFPLITFTTDTQQTSNPTPPGRLPYPSSELNYNSDNVQAAIKKYYSETSGYYTTLFWAKDNYYKMLGK